MKEVQTIGAPLMEVRDEIRNRTSSTDVSRLSVLSTASVPTVMPARRVAVAQTKVVILSKYGDRNQFLSRVNPSAQIPFARVPEKAVTGDYPTLMDINGAYGKDFDVEWLVVQVNDMATFTGARNLSEYQQEQLARTIAVAYPGLKITELLLFFHRFKTGRYGRFYGSVDPMVVTTALRDFIRERDGLRDAVSGTEAEQWQQWAEVKALPMVDAIRDELGLTAEQIYVGDVNGYQRKVRLSTDSREVFQQLTTPDTAQKAATIARQHLGEDIRLVVWLNIGGGDGLIITE